MEPFFQIIKVTIPITLGILVTLGVLALGICVFAAVVAWVQEHLI